VKKDLHLFSIPFARAVLIAAFAWTSLYGASAQEQTSVFGSAGRGESSLIGILYDLKQDQQHKPVAGKFLAVLGQFVREGWDEGILNAFYRATRPLNTTQVFIPLMSAEEAPRAFGVQDIMQPRQWVIHYKGQVRPPHPGTYRFVGLSDDLLAAAVNGKTVLLAEHPGSRLQNHGWRDSPRDGIQTPSGPAVSGDWFSVGENEVIDLDVLVGERPGSLFGAWLMVEEQGVKYDRDRAEKPIAPVFQLSQNPVPSGRVPESRPSRPDEIWKGVR